MCADVVGDPVGELAFVQHLAAVFGDQLEGPCEVGLDQRVLQDEAFAVSFVDLPRFGRVAQDEVEDRVQVCLSVVQLDPVPREVDRRPEELAPRERAEGAMRLLQADRRAGDRARGGADVEGLGRAAAEVDVDAVHLGELAL